MELAWEYLPHVHVTGVGPHITPWLSLFEVAIFYGMFILMGVVPVWLILATRRPVPYGIGWVAISACTAYCVGWIVDIPAAICVTTAATVVVVSLLVVRSYGYRLVRLPREMARGSRLDEFTIPHISNQESQSSSLSK
jgi:FtsH-binding integral membrane protein